MNTFRHIVWQRYIEKREKERQHSICVKQCGLPSINTLLVCLPWRCPLLAHHSTVAAGCLEAQFFICPIQSANHLQPRISYGPPNTQLSRQWIHLYFERNAMAACSYIDLIVLRRLGCIASASEMHGECYRCRHIQKNCRNRAPRANLLWIYCNAESKFRLQFALSLTLTSSCVWLYQRVGFLIAVLRNVFQFVDFGKGMPRLGSRYVTAPKFIASQRERFRIVAIKA